MERKTIRFNVKSIDEVEGTIEGYGATFSKDPDSYGDIIDPGAFTKTLKQNADNIVSLFNHDTNQPIGLPVAEQDKTGLYTKIKLVLEVQKAREVLALAKAGVIKRMSIGYEPVKTKFVDGIRHLIEVKLYDISPVIFAANQEALILSAKSLCPQDTMTLAEMDRDWDPILAARRIKSWAGGEESAISWDKYEKAFAYCNRLEPESFSNYKLGFADIEGKRMVAVPKGIFAAAEGLDTLEILEEEKEEIRAFLDRYYKNMRDALGDPKILPPWRKGATRFADLPLGGEDAEWDGGAAEKRVREWAGGDSLDWAKYAKGFMWFDPEDPEKLSSYKLGYADIIDGKLTAMPRAIYAIAAILKGGRGGVDIPDADKTKVAAHVNQYYEKLGKDSPLKSNEDAESDEKAIRLATAALKALLTGKADDLDPSLLTQDSSDLSEESANVAAVVANLKAENIGFDAKASEARISELIERLNNKK